jgi:hypothetical protein
VPLLHAVAGFTTFASVPAFAGVSTVLALLFSFLQMLVADATVVACVTDVACVPAIARIPGVAGVPSAAGGVL